MKAVLIVVVLLSNVGVWGWAIYNNQSKATKKAITPVVKALPRITSEVLLSPVVVRATTDNKRTINQMVSVSLWFNDAKQANYACALGPRLREALFLKMKKTKFKSDRYGKLKLSGMAKQLKPVMNKALNQNIIQMVHIIQGDRDIPVALMARLNKTGCIRLIKGEKKK